MVKATPKPIKRRIDITGTPDEVKAMLAVAQRVEPSIYKKDRVSPSKVILWYRSDGPINDLLTAIKKRAKVGKYAAPKREPKPKDETPVNKQA